MTQYAQLNATTTIQSEPGTSRTFRLPVMNPGTFHISATGYTQPLSAPAVQAGAATQKAGGMAAIGGPAHITPFNGTGAGIGQIGIAPVGPGGPAGPGGPGGPGGGPVSYPVSLDLFHGDVLVASGAPPASEEVTAANDDTWCVRVNFAADTQAGDNVSVALMPYTSTLPVLTRLIPLNFLQQGFDSNWNGRNYISVFLESDTLGIRFDPEIASYYHLTDLDVPLALGFLAGFIDLPNAVMVKDTRISIASQTAGAMDLPGPLTYIQVVVNIGSVDGKPMTGGALDAHFTLDDFSIIMKFFITGAYGSGDPQSPSAVSYVSQVTTDLPDKLKQTDIWIDPLTDVTGSIDTYLLNSVLYQGIAKVQNFFDTNAGKVGAALTPWLLGAAYMVYGVRYNPTNSQPIAPSGPPGPIVPQGDIVIDYIGLAESPGLGLLGQVGSQHPSGVLSITAVVPDGVIGTGYALNLTAAGGTTPYTWTTSGTLPTGLALTGESLHGTPSAAGVWSFELNVADAHGAHASLACAVAVNKAGFSIATASPLPAVAAGDAFAARLSATGGSGGLTWSATGLPPGLAISPAGIISGAPTGDGTQATIVVEAKDTTNSIARRALSLTVQPTSLFGDAIYTPRGAGDSIWKPPPAPAPPGHLTNLGAPVDPGDLMKAQHIVVLMMENRSFDHMLGYLSKEGGRADVEGLKWENDGNRTQFNFYDGRFYYPNPLTETHLFNPESIGPDHSFESVKSQMDDNMGHFVSDYARNKIADGDPSQLSQVMGYYTGEQLPTYDMLAREYAICDHWFCSHPGPTWPNRFVYLTGDLNRDSYGEAEVNTPLYSDFTPSEATTIFDLLSDRGVTWQYFEQRVSTMRAYTKYTFDMVNVLQYSDPVKGFAVSAKKGLPSVTFVDPLFGDLPAGIGSPQDNDDAPPSDLADGQKFVAEVVSTLFTRETNPNWLNTMLIIVYDEHGGFYDHVQPPSDAVPLLGQTCGKLGPRVPAFVVSPWTPAGLVLKEVFDHTSIAATILRRFCSPHPPFMSARVSAARDLRDALPLKIARGEMTAILGGLKQGTHNASARTEPRDFKVSSTSDAFGTLLAAIALNLGQGAAV